MVLKIILFCLYAFLIFLSISLDNKLAALAERFLPFKIVLVVLLFPLYASTLVHELGHAVVFILMTRQPAVIVLGKAFEEIKNDASIHSYKILRLGLLRLYFPNGWYVLNKGCFDGKPIPDISYIKIKCCSLAGSAAGALCILSFLYFLLVNFKTPAGFYAFFYGSSIWVFVTMAVLMFFNLLNFLGLLSLLPSKDHDGYWFGHPEEWKKRESLFDILEQS